MIHNDNGIYIVFEGVDFSGKTTLSTYVSDALEKESIPQILTKHPGATPLGLHLRKLVKNPEKIDSRIAVDPISAQVLMMVDQICFINTLLIPQLDNGAVVIADRANFISAIAYGIPEGVTSTQLNKLFQLVESPSPDRIFIMRTPWDEIEKRRGVSGRGADRFEDRGDSYLKKVADIYDNFTIRPELLVLVADYVPIENIVYLDGTKTIEELTEQVTQEVLSISKDKGLG